MLVADVLGSDDDSVTWSSSDPSVASVEQSGKVTGLNAGNVVITATSVKDPTKQGTWNFEVTLPYAHQMSLKVTTDDDVVYNKTSDRYEAKLAHEIKIEAVFDIAEYKPLSVSWKVVYPSQETQQVGVSVKKTGDTTATVTSISSLKEIQITATASYGVEAEAMVATVVFDFLEPEVTDAQEKVTEILRKFSSDEANSLLSSKLSRKSTYHDKTLKSSRSEELSLDSHSFLDGTYVQEKTKNTSFDGNSTEKSANYYHGVVETNGVSKYVAFSYDEDQKIQHKYTAEVNPGASRLTDAKKSFIPGVYNISVGIDTILSDIFTSTASILDGNVLGFGCMYLEPYTKYEYNGSSAKVTSSAYSEDMEATYTLSLDIKLDNSRISGFTFTETVDRDNSKLEFTETHSDFVYGTKVKDSSSNPRYINFDQYYLTSFDLVDFHGTVPNVEYGGLAADYSNDKKYGVAPEEITTVDGLTKYSITYDRSLILKVTDALPTSVDYWFDSFSITLSNPGSIATPTDYGAGIFTINPAKDENGFSLPGSSRITFTSAKGYSKTVIVEFRVKELTSVDLDVNGGLTKADDGIYDFRPIYIGDDSDYFFINTDPAEDKYSFGVKLLSGPTQLTINRYAKDNEKGLPGFSYYLKPTVAGTYVFQVYVMENTKVVTERTYRLVVMPPRSNSEVLAGILGNTYQMRSSTYKAEFKFVDSSTLRYTEVEDLNGSTKTVDFAYSVIDGRVMIAKNQNFGSGSSYASTLYAGEITFDNAFERMHVTMSISGAKMVQSFKKYVAPSTTGTLADVIAGKSMTKELSFGLNYKVTVSFTTNKGTIVIQNFSSNEVEATITFDYVATKDTFSVSNITSTSTVFTLKDDYKTEYSSAYNTINLHLYKDFGGWGMDPVFEFEL
ncbi:MAG: Ig-like domain-containing protein [Bacilli bacterium]|nr:Ig-like domain-containing protein [Bacilli bacterium]